MCLLDITLGRHPQDRLDAHNQKLLLIIPGHVDCFEDEMRHCEVQVSPALSVMWDVLV